MNLWQRFRQRIRRPWCQHPKVVVARIPLRSMPPSQCRSVVWEHYCPDCGAVIKAKYPVTIGVYP